MTIRIRVANMEEPGSRAVDVIAVDYEKGKSDRSIRERTTLQPGEAREFYVHKLREITVEEP